MKTRTLKKALSLFLAVLMIALALPLTMLLAAAEETTESTPASIKDVKMFAKLNDTYDLHVAYGSVAGMIDGDPYKEFFDTDKDGKLDDGEIGGNFKRSERRYYESDAITAPYTDLYVDSEPHTYYGYAVFELNGMSALNDITIWLTGNGYNETTAAHWSDPTRSWSMNNAYEILVSDDGETWSFLKEYTDMCGDGTVAGDNFPVVGTDAYATKTVDGFPRVGFKMDLRDAEGNVVVKTKYFAIAVTEPSKDNCIDIGEVTVNGTVITPDSVEKTPAEIYAEAKPGTLLKAINFNDMSWNDDYVNSDWWNTYYKVSDDGRTVRHILHEYNVTVLGAKNRRAMWGGIKEGERFPLGGDNTYTIFFDAAFGVKGNNSSAGNLTGIGLQVNGDDVLLIDGSGNSYWWHWNTQKVGKTSTTTEKWNEYIDDRTMENSFAVEVDCKNDRMTLYVARNYGTVDGAYVKVRELTYDGADLSGELLCRVYTRRVSGTEDGITFWSEVSDIKIYKGLVATTAEYIAPMDRAAEYKAAADGALLETINFTENTWYNRLYNVNNNGAEVALSEDGTTAKLTLLEGVSSNRAMYGGMHEATKFPLRDGTDTYKYTLVFDLDFGITNSNKVGFGIMVDGNHSIVISGYGYVYRYEWNDKRVDPPKDENDEYAKAHRWNYKTDVAKDSTHTFAIEVDPETNILTLYVMSFDGTFEEVVSMTFDPFTNSDGEQSPDLGNTLNPRIYMKKLGGTSDQTYWAEVSDIKIYKGFIADGIEDIDRVAEYNAAEDGELLETIDFNNIYWKNGFADENNLSADVEPSEDGSSVKLTLLEHKWNCRAMYGGLQDAYQYPLQDENGNTYKYTLVFDLEFGDNTYDSYGLGIQVDESHSIVIDGFGCNYYYRWNDQHISRSDKGEDKWNYATDKAKTDKQTFAVEVDAESETMTLYVADGNGKFNAVRTMTYTGELNHMGDTLSPRIYIIKIDKDKSYTCGEDTWAEVSDLKIYKGHSVGVIQNSKGASVRVVEGTTGIRFRGEFRKYMLDSLRDKYGEKNVELGMIITPTDYLTATGADFTMEALDACTTLPAVKYVNVKGTVIHVDEDDLFYYVNCALVNIKEGNYAREFSARAYIKVNGEIYKYADFDADYHSRSISEVARKAYGDTETEKGGDYVNAIDIAGVTVYSPYDADEMKILRGFFENLTEKELNSSISVLSYNIEMKRSDDGWAGRTLSKVVETITAANPDVVALQEDTDDWYEEESGSFWNKTYTNHLEGLENAGYASTNFSGDDERLNIFWKADKFSLETKGGYAYKNLANTVAAPDGADMSRDTQGRRFSYAVLEDNAGKKILVVNTHLHYRKDSTDESSTPENDAVRQYEARILRKWLDDMAAEYPNQIVVGDMNNTPTTATISEYTNGDEGFTSAMDGALIVADKDATLVSSSTYVDRNKYIFDYVLYRNVEAREYTVIENKIDEVNGVKRYPSDHLPVYAKFLY